MEPVLKWDVASVAKWFNQNGFSGYSEVLKEHGIDGEALIHLDHEALKDLGVRALGKRLLILKAIYFLKIQNDIPITSSSYIPQTVDVEPDIVIPQTTVVKYYEEQMQFMKEEINKLADELTKVREDMRNMHRHTFIEGKSLLSRQASSRRPKPIDMDDATGIPSYSGIHSSTSARLHSPTPSAKSTSSPIADSFMRDNSSGIHAGSGDKPSPRGSEEHGVGQHDGFKPHLRVYGSNGIQRRFESYKSIKINPEDQCSDMLPLVLEKYHIRDDWKNYSLHIDYITDLSGKNERPVKFDEKPLLLLNQLKRENRDPKFFLKSVRSSGAFDYFGSSGAGSLSPINGGPGTVPSNSSSGNGGARGGFGSQEKLNTGVMVRQITKTARLNSD
ncbi:hypothetical protein EV182_004221 [Spiromyces aspiralis]|uniref:Uncharacterized protein n=1 Tax=Spiromyces aspiralis TaxID=68401 RepID=A0ACC1HCA9_9FUNG|nr:hypothetical protein EV182_004221 [Spiromyces aspiralis]